MKGGEEIGGRGRGVTRMRESEGNSKVIDGWTTTCDRDVSRSLEMARIIMEEEVVVAESRT